VIDCHAHAYPTLDDRLSQLSPAFAGGVRDAQSRLRRHLPKAASALAGRARSVLERSLVDVEKLANLRRDHEGIHRYESLLSLGLLPQVLSFSSATDLLASMEKHGITRTVLIAAEPVASNEWVLAQARASEGRFIPVVNMPAMRDDTTETQWGDALRALAAEGARGFKIHLNTDGLGATHKAYAVAFDVAREHGLFVIIHTGCFHLPGYKLADHAEPSLFTPLFERQRDVRVCLAHMNRDRPEEAWAIMRRFDQVWADTSWQGRDAVRRARDEVGCERILLGSDWPFLHPGLQGDVLNVLHDALGDADAERVGKRNAQTFLAE
jgi:predicted TIM-barrel fold metal-dependent hydrolase